MSLLDGTPAATTTPSGLRPSPPSLHASLQPRQTAQSTGSESISPQVQPRRALFGLQPEAPDMDGPKAEAADGAGAPTDVLRCVADLEAAVAYLRACDPRLVPLIDTHGLPQALVVTRRTLAAACPPPSTAGDLAGAQPGIDDDDDILQGCTYRGARLRNVARTAGEGEGGVYITGSGDASAAAPMTVAGTGGATADGEDGGWGGGRGSGVFAALARAVVYQQLATNAAAAIWGRVLAACKVPSCDLLTPRHVLAVSPEQLRGAGLSGRKLEYLVGLAEAFAGRDGWDEQLSACTDLSVLISELTPLRGVGTWTVHMLAMFHLGLPDVLPSGDLGVRRGLQQLHGLPQLPGPAEVGALTEAWRPYRSVGSWYMWRITPPPRVAASGSKRRAKGDLGTNAKRGSEKVRSKAGAEDSRTRMGKLRGIDSDGSDGGIDGKVQVRRRRG